MASWALIGGAVNWHHSILNMDKTRGTVLWAFNKKNPAEYKSLGEGDEVFLGTNQGKSGIPKRGVLGYGRILEKLAYDNSKYWPEDYEPGDYWPHRFTISISRLAPSVSQGKPPQEWTDVIPVVPGNTVMGSSFPLAPEPRDIILNLMETRWHLPITLAIEPEEMLRRRDLLIEPSTVRQVLAHLKAGKHLIIAGPPGTGKTELAVGVAEALGHEPYLTTATAEWTRHHVIGGPVIHGDHVRWESGSLLIALHKHLRNQASGGPYRGCYLLIDEFNRANMDKAFGELYTIFSSTDPDRWTIPDFVYHQIRAFHRDDLDEPGKTLLDKNVTRIPRDFRILATINTFDKSYLYTLSYGLQRRFATVFVEPPLDTAAERELILRRAGQATTLTPPAETAITTLYDMVKELRAVRPIGTAHAIDAAKFLASYLTAHPDTGFEPVERALIAYVSPQLEGLTEEQYNKVQELVKDANMQVFSRHLVEMYPLFRK